jgi:hypothetical protein
MNKSTSKVTRASWILISVWGTFGCDRAADLGAYIGGHARSTPADSAASSTSAAPIQLESPVPLVAAAPATVASATPRYPIAAVSSAPTHSAAVAPVALAPSGQNEEGGRPRPADEPEVRTPPPASKEVAAAVSAKPSEAPSPPAPKAGVIRNASVGGGAVSGGNVSNAARVIAGLRASIRSCYTSDSASADGGMRLKLVLGANGAVTSVNSTRSPGPHGGPGPSDRVVACATSAAQHAQFAPPENGKAEITFPVTFFEQEAMPPKRTTL